MQPVGAGREEHVLDALAKRLEGFAIAVAEFLVALQRLDAAPLVLGRHARVELAPGLEAARTVAPVLVLNGLPTQHAGAGLAPFALGLGFGGFDPASQGAGAFIL